MAYLMVLSAIRLDGLKKTTKNINHDTR